MKIELIQVTLERYAIRKTSFLLKEWYIYESREFSHISHPFQGLPEKLERHLEWLTRPFQEAKRVFDSLANTQGNCLFVVESKEFKRDKRWKTMRL